MAPWVSDRRVIFPFLRVSSPFARLQDFFILYSDDLKDFTRSRRRLYHISYITDLDVVKRDDMKIYVRRNIAIATGYRKSWGGHLKGGM